MHRHLFQRWLLVATLIAGPASAEPRSQARAAGLALLGVGTLVFAGGVVAHRASGDWTLPSTLLATTGAMAVGGGVALLWTTHPDSNVALKLAPPALDLVAGRDPKRGSDLGLRLPLWRTSF